MLQAKKVLVSDNYLVLGVVSDPYRWLEEPDEAEALQCTYLQRNISPSPRMLMGHEVLARKIWLFGGMSGCLYGI
jgi:hypothetical protein